MKNSGYYFHRIQTRTARSNSMNMANHCFVFFYTVFSPYENWMRYKNDSILHHMAHTKFNGSYMQLRTCMYVRFCYIHTLPSSFDRSSYLLTDTDVSVKRVPGTKSQDGDTHIRSHRFAAQSASHIWLYTLIESTLTIRTNITTNTKNTVELLCLCQ